MITLEQRKALAEVDTISSIRFVLLYSAVNNNPFYEERFGIFETDPMLFTGLFSAITIFLDDLAKEGVRGFQTMRRDDVTITSHTTSISIMTVVSDHALP
ncbi:MAG: hypothetical protein ACXAB7_23065, partial [Candidatus Kariarchaeaceae archaeon]